jgi:hypothetical protein
LSFASVDLLWRSHDADYAGPKLSFLFGSGSASVRLEPHDPGDAGALDGAGEVMQAAGLPARLVGALGGGDAADCGHDIELEIGTPLQPVIDEMPIGQVGGAECRGK